MAEAKSEELNSAIREIIGTLTVFDAIAGRLDPSRLIEYRSKLADKQAYREAVQTLTESAQDDEIGKAAGRLAKVAEWMNKGSDLFFSEDTGQKALFKVFRAFRFFARAKEELFPMIYSYPAINQYFWTGNGVPPESAGDDGVDRGLFDAQNGRGKRGGFHLYVPESYRPDTGAPLVIALHGGSGHGADFLWSWLPDARTRGCLVLSATSKANTWSLSNPALDIAGLKAMLDYVFKNYTINKDKILLTGISDGGTYSLIVAAVLQEAPFTHYAPVACAANAVVKAKERLAGKKIYLVHGERDWMFRVDTIREAAGALKAAGVVLTYKEIADLSHNYPRDENTHILDWFLEPVD